MYAVSVRHTNAGIQRRTQESAFASRHVQEIERLKETITSLRMELRDALSDKERYIQEIDRLSAIERYWQSCSASAMEILKKACQMHSCDINEVRGQPRYKEIMNCRWDAIVAIKWLRPDLSYPAIGRIFGGRDHTTIMNACRSRGYNNGWPETGPEFANAEFGAWVAGEFHESQD